MSNSDLKKLEPNNVWAIFEEITKIPRPSKKEEKIRNWIKKWAKENSIEIKKEDKAGNLLLFKPATKGCEKYPTLIIQAHMDMVCQKRDNHTIDFDNDPLIVFIDGENVKAKNTSLGADNGIGMAFGLASLIDKNLKHGPLEILLTVDEETGLTGAFAIKAGFFSGKYLLNVDSESIGKITISSAGGGGTDFIIPIKYDENDDCESYRLEIKGLQGGHSGVDIDLPRLNAIKIGIDGLLAIQNYKIKLVNITAGSAHNAIPRDFSVEFIIPKEFAQKAKGVLSKWRDNTLKIGRETEKNLEIKIDKINKKSAVAEDATIAILNLLDDIHHGPISFSEEIPGLVQTSNNLATVKTSAKEIIIHVSTRSSVDSEMKKVRNELKNLGEKYKFNIKLDEAYPGWKPDISSPFITLVKEKYEEFLKRKVELVAIHAGLECGLFSALDPQLQIASIGPNIHNAHSPDEFIEIKSVEILWNIIKMVIENMGTLS